MSFTDRSSDWPRANGEAAELIRNMDATATPLGAREHWPQALRDTIELILPSSAQIAVFWGPDCVTFYNDAYAATLGKKHPAAMGRPGGEQAPEIWHKLEPTFESVRLGAQGFGAREWPFVINRNGKLETLFFDFAWSPVRGDDGQVDGVLCIVVETTAQVRASRALAASESKARESNKQLKLAQAAGGIGVFVLDVATDMLSVTDEFCRIFGLPARESLPASEIECLSVEPGQAMSTRENRADASARLDVEYRIQRGDDGAVRWISRRAEVLRDAHGKLVLVRGVVQDITDAKQAEATLQQSEARFQALAQALPNQVWTADADGLLDWASESMCAYTGVSVEALCGAGWARIVHPDDLPRAWQVWAASLASGRPYETEARVRRHDGQWRWHLTRAQPIEAGSEAGTGRRWVGTNTDIDDQKAAQARLARSVRERTRDRNRLWRMSADIMVMVDVNGSIAAVNPAWGAMLGWGEAQLLGLPFLDLLHPDDSMPLHAEIDRMTRGRKRLRVEIRMRHQDGSHRVVSWTGAQDARFLHAVGRDVTALRAGSPPGPGGVTA